MKLVLALDMAYAYACGDPEAVGGAERAQWLLARALARSGWSVTIGVRQHLVPGQKNEIGGVQFVGMNRGAFIRAWSALIASEKPAWWYMRGADPLLGAMVFVAKTMGVRGIFAAAFDLDVHPRIALTRRERWWPL